MFFQNLLKSGWVHALFIAMFSYPFASISQKLVASHSDVNILAYTGMFMLFAAITLLIIAGPGELAMQTLKRFETWLYAILQIISYILFLYSLLYATATQGAALAMLGGVFIFIFSIAFLKQHTNIYEVIGCLSMCVGLYAIIHTADISANEKAVLSLIIIVRGFIFGFQKIITEIHKTNRKAESFKSQMRVTGFIMAVASFMYILFLLVIASVKHKYEIHLFSHFPNFSDFINFDMIIFSLFVGGFVVSSTKYCEFYAGKTIGAKYLTSITSLQLIFVYIMEIILSKFNIINPSLDHSIILYLVVILLGNFIISMAGFIKDISFIKKGEKQDTLANLERNFIDNEDEFNLMKVNLSSLLNLYDNNIKELSKDLKIEFTKLDNIIQYDLDELKIQKKLANKINSFAAKHLTTVDKLTKAYNRYYLDYTINDLFKSDIKFNLYYLDLNKFKPVNDIYGHHIGDYVLKELVSRLMTVSDIENQVFRLGGDEFILIQSKNIDEDISKNILDIVEKPIEYRGLLIEISTSIGLSKSSEFHSLDELLENADKQMFNHKIR